MNAKTTYIREFQTALDLIEEATAKVNADGVQALTEYMGVGEVDYTFTPRGEAIDAYDFVEAITPRFSSEETAQLEKLNQKYTELVNKLFAAAGLKLTTF